jgi:virulence-associated protein VagC
MAEYADREHFIPLRKSDLVQLLTKDKQLLAAERDAFRQFCLLVSAVFHFEYLKQLEELKDAYAAFDPDSDTRALQGVSPDERHKQLDELYSKFTALMERANFKKLERTDIEEALRERSSELGLPTDVDLSIFERLEVFVRGDAKLPHSRRRWQRLWRKEEVLVPVFQRMVMIVKLRPHRRLDKDIRTDPVYLKVFKNIPKSDQDMLLPGARVRLSKLDQALIIYPLATGIGLMVFNIGANIFSKGLAVLGGLLSWSLAAALGGYGYKSYHAYQVKKQEYTLRLTKSLYYQTLDSNTGVLMRLLDEAEEQECRETFLAYFCLWKFAPPGGWTAEQLDDYVELYLESNANLKVDFEIGDALAKLERLKIVQKVGDSYKAQPVDKALEMLDWTWDNYFKYNVAGGEKSTVA